MFCGIFTPENLRTTKPDLPFRLAAHYCMLAPNKVTFISYTYFYKYVSMFRVIIHFCYIYQSCSEDISGIIPWSYLCIGLVCVRNQRVLFLKCIILSFSARKKKNDTKIDLLCFLWYIYNVLQNSVADARSNFKKVDNIEFYFPYLIISLKSTNMYFNKSLSATTCRPLWIASIFALRIIGSFG